MPSPPDPAFLAAIREGLSRASSVPDHAALMEFQDSPTYGDLRRLLADYDARAEKAPVP